MKDKLYQVKELLDKIKKEEENVQTIEDWKETIPRIIQKFLLRHMKSSMPERTLPYKNTIPYHIRMFFNHRKVRIDFNLRSSWIFYVKLNWRLARKIGFYDDKLGEVRALFYFLDKIIAKLEKRCKREEYLEGLLKGLKILKEKTKGVKLDFDLPK